MYSAGIAQCWSNTKKFDSHNINNNNTKMSDEGKMKNTNDFLYNMDNKIKTIENYMKDNNKNKNCRDNSLLQVYTSSKWKFRKKTHK